MSKKKKNVEETTDELGDILTDHLNKKFGKSLGKVAYSLTDEDAPTNVNEFVSSGCDTLDVVLSNRKDGGFPVGRISEVSGLEGTGKSLLVAHTLAETQKKGGLAIMIDTESAVSKQFLKAIGVDVDKLLYTQLDELESIFEAIEEIISKVREGKNKDRLVTIVVDSVMGSTTKDEKASEWNKDGYATQKAIILSKAMRKITNTIAKERVCLIFTNQLRIKMNAGYGDPYQTSGGLALGFHSSVRVRLKSKAKLTIQKSGKNEVVGVKTQALCFKNRIGPPHRYCTFNIYYESGIDNESSWLESLTKFNIIKTSGSWKTFVSKKTGETIKFQSLSDFKEQILDVPEYKDELYDELCEEMVMHYKVTEEDEVEEISDLEDLDNE